MVFKIIKLFLNSVLFIFLSYWNLSGASDFIVGHVQASGSRMLITRKKNPEVSHLTEEEHGALLDSPRTEEISVPISSRRTSTRNSASSNIVAP